ncbi:MAG TPA: ABC transporter ATP-binding protein [Alphaproteobacteria bacterium]|nr:ABC transporter ATP-binding protein [Alphaproteobacteria bacterium]
MSAPILALEKVSLSLGAFALKGIDLALASGEILTLMGPNGAGKSVLLETVAGFHALAAGSIAIGGADMARVPPERRHVGFIFQNFGLFPHMSVAENVAIGLARRGRAGGIASEVGELLERFGLAALADRDPADLSPGEKQRTALARCLATRPALFLLDEPFSAIDARTSDALRAELKAFLIESRIPALFVTHDIRDVAALGDRAAVMRAGALVQIGVPDALFRRPASRFVAEFLGVENLLAARTLGRAGAGHWFEVAGRALHVAEAEDDPGPAPLLSVRAGDVRILSPSDVSHARPGLNRLSGIVARLAPDGPLTRVTLDCGFDLVAYALSRSIGELGLDPGAAATVEIDARDVHVIAESRI